MTVGKEAQWSGFLFQRVCDAPARVELAPLAREARVRMARFLLGPTGGT